MSPIVEAPTPKSLLFFTAANPPTGNKGHIGLVQHFLDEGNFDTILVIPMVKSTKHSNLASYQHRVNMARLAFESLSSKVIVQQQAEQQKLEEGEEEETGILPIIARMKMMQESADFSVVLGSNSYPSFADEVQAEESTGISSKLKSVIVVHRATSPLADNTTSLDDVPVIGKKLDNLGYVSSHDLARSFDPKFLIEHTQHDVLRYMERKRLFSFNRGALRGPKPAREIPRNPTMDMTAQLQTQSSAQEPKHFLSDTSPVLTTALCEMLRRKVTENPLEWLAQYLKLHNEKLLKERDEQLSREEAARPGSADPFIELNSRHCPATMGEQCEPGDNSVCGKCGLDVNRAETPIA